MTKGIFCHDLPVYKDKNGVYCSTTMTDDLFRRYLTVVDELIVATRVYPIDKTYEDAHQEKITLPNVSFLEFKNLNTLKGVFFDIPEANKRIYDTMKSVDLIFIRGGIIANLGAHNARKLNKPYLIEVSGRDFDAYWNHSFKGKIIAPFMEYLVRKDVRNATHAVYVTEKWLQKYYPTNGVSTYASNVILKEVNENVLEKRIEKLSSFDINKKIVIGTTGGINNKAKGQRYVIEAIKKLQDKFNFSYELVGGGDNTYLKEVALKNGVQDRVIFKVQLSHYEVLNWLDSIDLYIQPSMQEGLPRAVIEAMSRACPVIGSTTGGIPELLEPEAIFKRGSVKSLCKVLEAYLNTDLKVHARVNFDKSKEYLLSELDARRDVLYHKYKDYVENFNR